MGKGARRRGIAAAAVVLGIVAPTYTVAAESWLVEGGEVEVLVPLEPGGAFEARSSSLNGELTPGTGSPLALTGELTLDLASVDTGIALRNEHMRERLELSRGRDFAEAALSEIVLSDATDASFRGRTPFEGLLLFHGVSRPVSGEARVEAAGAALWVEASFVLDLTAFDVEPPMYMGVGVTNRLVVTVSFSTTPKGR